MSIETTSKSRIDWALDPRRALWIIVIILAEGLDS